MLRQNGYALFQASSGTSSTTIQSAKEVPQFKEKGAVLNCEMSDQIVISLHRIEFQINRSTRLTKHKDCNLCHQQTHSREKHTFIGTKSVEVPLSRKIVREVVRKNFRAALHTAKIATNQQKNILTAYNTTKRSMNHESSRDLYKTDRNAIIPLGVNSQMTSHHLVNDW